MSDFEQALAKEITRLKVRLEHLVGLDVKSQEVVDGLVGLGFVD